MSLVEFSKAKVLERSAKSPISKEDGVHQKGVSDPVSA